MKIHEDPHGEAPSEPLTTGPVPIVDKSNTSASAPSSVPLQDVIKPTATKQRPPLPSHFLTNVNLSSFDIRAIPDPPSPAPKLRRRLSMPSARHDHCQSSPLISRSSAVTTRRRTSHCQKANQPVLPKRCRQSLGHVPTTPTIDLWEDGHQTHSTPASPPAPQASPLQPASLRVEMCFDEDYENDTVESPRKRRKRQSMQLPRELVQDVQIHKTDASRNKPLTSPPSSLPLAHTPSVSLKELQGLVRGFCRHSKEKRKDCSEAHQIEIATGYPLAPPKIKGDRHFLLQQLAPLIQEMDRRKTLETKFWRDATHCRVERASRGKFRYISLETNEKIKSQEYHRRYRTVLQNEASERLARANVWKEAFKAEQVECGNQGLVAASFTKDGDMSMELCDKSVSIELDPSQTVMDVVKRDASHALIDKREETNNDLEREHSLQVTVLGDNHKSLRTVTPTELEFLPIPDRDHISNDPEIAKAEQQLWNKMDAALEEYSQTVSEILKTRRDGIPKVRI